MAYDNTNSGALFKSRPKTKDEDRDYNGGAEIACPHCRRITEYWVSCWINTASERAKNPGQQYFSIRFNAKDDAPPDHNAPTQAPPKDFDDDIPF